MKQKLFTLLMLLVTSVTGVWADNVCKIGDTPYATLADAVAAVPTDGTETTITMIANCETRSVTIPETKNITLDLNGKTVVGKEDDIICPATEGYYFRPVIYNLGTFVITDNTEAKEGKMYSAGSISITYDEDKNFPSNWITVLNKGTLTVENGWLGDSQKGSCGNNIYNYGTATINGGHFTRGPVEDADMSVWRHSGYTFVNKYSAAKMTINGGYIYGNHRGPINNSGTLVVNDLNVDARIYYYLVYNADGSATINGGTYTQNAETGSEKGIVFYVAGGTVEVNGGKYSHDESSFSTHSVTYTIATNGTTKQNILKGGIYDADPTAYVADGYIKIDNPDETTEATYPYKVVPAVAQITTDGTTVKYATLEAAVAAVPTTSAETTIKMIADETFSQNATVSVAASQNIILDLNGHIISGTSDSGNGTAVITASYAMLTNYGTLTIKDGTEKKNGKITYKGVNESTGSLNYYQDLIVNSGTLTLESGTLENLTENGMAVYVVDNNTTSYSATFNMTGGTMNATQEDVRLFANSALNNDVNVSGGTLIGGYGCIWAQEPSSNVNGKQTVKISGGTFQSGNLPAVRLGSFASKTPNAFANSKVEISGGYFNVSPIRLQYYFTYSGGSNTEYADVISISGGYFKENTYNAKNNGTLEAAQSLNNFVVTGKCVVDNTEEATKDAYPWTIGVAKTYVAQIDDTKYETLIAAIEAAKNGDEIDIINDITSSDVNYQVNKPNDAFTIDLNGHHIENTDTWRYLVIFSKVTFKDSKGGGYIRDVKIDGSNLPAIYCKAGADVTLESGDVLGQVVVYPNGSPTSKAKFTMNGGSVTANSNCAVLVQSWLPGTLDDSEFIINGGTITATNGDGVQMFCDDTHTAKFTMTGGSITANGSAVINGNGSHSGIEMNISGGELVGNGSNTIGIYNPLGDITISGGTITGTTALVVKGGTVNISGNAILNATGAAVDPTSAEGSGTNNTGDALYLEANYGTSEGVAHDIAVTISGGTFTSANNHAIGADFVASTTHATPTVAISGGLFKSAENKDVFAKGNGFDGTILTSGGYYSTTATDRSDFQTTYVATGYKAIANDGLNSSASVDDYPTMIGQVTQEEQQIDVKEGGSGTKTATATIAITATPQAGDATITTEVQQKINATTTVSGVELTTTPSTGETYSGIQTVVNNAKSAGTEEFKTAITEATNIDVHVDVKVTPSALTATTALNSIKYALQPVATVTFSKDGTNYKSTTTDVTNAMIDQTKDIAVSIYTGFKPIRIRHNADDEAKTLIETFTEDQITYDETTGVATVTIHHFSTLTAEQEEVTGTIYYATTEGNQTVENATLKTFVETTRATYPNAVMVVAAENKDKVSSVENVIVDNGESATPRYTCPNFVLTDLCESEYDAMDDETLKDVINFYSPVTFTATAGSYHRSLRSGYNSACVPFALSSIDNASLLKYEYFDGTSGHIYFSQASSIAAGEATIILTSAATEWNEDLAGKEIVGTPAESTGDTFFGGVFVTTNAYHTAAGATGYYSVNTENGMFAALKNYLFPLRACFKLTMSGQTAREFSIAIIDSSATGVDSIGTESISDNSIYTIDGKRVESANSRGMYIINGKKVIK